MDARRTRDESPPKPRQLGPSLARLIRLARPEWKRLALATVALLLGSGMGLLYPQAIQLIIDEALKHQNVEVIDRAAMWLAVIAAVQAVAIGARVYLFSTSGERVVTRLRETLYRSVLAQEIGFFDERRTGELTSRLASDTTVIQGAVSWNISMVLRNLAQAVGGVVLLVYTSPTLAALMLAIVPPVALGAVAYGRRVRKLSRKVQDALARAGEVAEETIAGVRTVRSFAAEKVEVARYGGAVNEAFELARRRARASSAFMGASSFAGFVAAAVVLWYGSRLVLDDRLTIGGLTSFLVYTIMVAFSLGALSELWADFMRSIGAAERVFELLDRKPAMPLEGGARPERVEGRLELRKVRFAYPSRPDVEVLRGVDLAIEPGEMVALVGASGGGKSTVAALVARLYDPTAGRVMLDGNDLRELDPTWLRQQIGAVAQEPILFSTTVADNIRYGRPGATDAEVEAAARAANAHDFIAAFPQGYRTLVGERGIQLSGGQKQRVAIARALLKDPRILVLDEATSALDAESEFLVREALERLMRGRTTLVIAHRLSTVVGADRVLVMEGGRIIESGRHDELLERGGVYRKLVERQFVAA